MDFRTLREVDRFVAIWGISIAIGSALSGDARIIFGAGLGGVLGMADWIGLRYTGVRLAATGDKRIFGAFLALRGGLFLAVVAAVLFLLPVHPLALLAGLSSIVLGILTFCIWQGFRNGEKALKEVR